jgi:hypothetical protein
VFVGILLDDANASRVSVNRVVRNGDDIIVFGDDNTIAGNDVARAVGLRRRLRSRHLARGRRGQPGDPQRGGPHVAGRHPRRRVRAGGSDARQRRARQLVHDAGSMGCRSEPRATGRVTGTVLGRNVALRSSDGWIDVESPLTTLTRNLALHNTDLGIEAVPGVTAGGGNRAR